jgi:two-component system nitrogen regulation sensor histidine kinase NtrY
MSNKPSFETRLTRLSLASSIPLLLLSVWTMIYADVSIWLVILVVLLGSLLTFYCVYQIHHKIAYQFRSLSNLLNSMVQGDYTLRARSVQGSGALDELTATLNRLAERLSQQRWESVESQLLLTTVIEHIDVAIVALSEDNTLRLLNPAAKKLLSDTSESHERLLGQLAFVQSCPSGWHQVVELSLGHQQGRFNIHLEEFRESGRQHKLLFIADVRTLLRSEEIRAWQSLVRVMSHEINNSLSPIASISQTLSRLIDRDAADTAYHEDLLKGLAIIGERANGLSQFVESYKQLAKLPEPQKQHASVRLLCEKACALFKRSSIAIESTIDAELFIDPVQFEQVLINLIKNAIEAMAHTNPAGVIRIRWFASGPVFTLTICDEGEGVSNPDNLFVPFYSTKKHGSGIGLVLCRQIIEAHGGRLSVTNQPMSRGCCASIEVPFHPMPHGLTHRITRR